MKNPLEWWRQRQARRRFMPQTGSRSAATTMKFAIAALIIIFVAAGLLEMRRGTGAEAALIDYMGTAGVEPLALVGNAAQTRRLIVISDISSAAAPKNFAAEAVERLATTTGLDIVGVDIPADEQPYLDRYLATAPEDASILLSRPRAVREGDGASRALLDLYRTVWRVNQELGAARRIRIIALDPPQWPPARATAPAAAAATFGERSEHMMNALTERALGRNPQARGLFLVDGLHALEHGGGRVQTGGARPVDVQWFAARLAERFPQDVYSILVDASTSRVISTDVAAYGGTAFAEVLRRGGVSSGTAVPTHAAFNDMARQPVRVIGTTGLDFQLEPRSAPFTQLVDAYIYLGGG